MCACGAADDLGTANALLREGDGIRYQLEAEVARLRFELHEARKEADPHPQ